MTEYTVTATNLALPHGARFICRSRFPIEAGADCLLMIGRRLTIGSYYPNIAGYDWIKQPDRIIKVDDKVDIEIWGVVEPLGSGPALEQIVQSSLLVASAATVKILGLLASMAASLA
jgi:hypothetical protein